MIESKFNFVRLSDGTVLDGFQVIDAVDLQKERSALRVGDDLVSLDELAELTGNCRATIDRRVSRLGGRPKRIDRGLKVLPVAWVRANASALFGGQ
jgi:hypothetical protein